MESFESGLEDKERIERLRADFFNLFPQLDDKEGVDALFNDLVSKYSEEGRYYHNLDHIERFLSFLARFREDIRQWQEVNLAAWFHDAIYDTTRKDNEQKSAEYARQELSKLGIPEETIFRIEELVIATIGHEIVNGDFDADIFLDADLELLAISPEEFETNTAKIRKEYGWVSDLDFKAGRLKFLQSMLAKPRIYKTERVYNELEERARENIRRSIEQLKN